MGGFLIPVDDSTLAIAFIVTLILLPFILLANSSQKKEQQKSQEHFENVLNVEVDQINKEKKERRRKLSQG